MIKQIKATTDYDLFEFERGNRPVSERVKHLVTRIKEKDQLADYPILCFQNGSKKLVIADGQHRLEAAKALKIPIYYHVATAPLTISDIALANSLQKPWSLPDYVYSWTQRGKSDYRYLKNYCDAYGISITYAAVILSGTAHEAHSGMREAIKNGSFKADNKTFGEKVGPFLAQMKRVIGYSLPRPLMVALIKLCRLSNFSLSRMIKKMEGHKAMFLKCGTWAQYVDILESIYNSNVRKSELAALKISVQASERHEPKKKKAT